MSGQVIVQNLFEFWRVYRLIKNAQAACLHYLRSDVMIGGHSDDRDVGSSFFTDYCFGSSEPIH